MGSSLTRRRRLCLLLMAVIAAVVSTQSAQSAIAQAAPSASPSRNPVLIELFTSEGCSDCPPADALLAELDARQFVSSAQAIVLSEHVTYWNHLGWRDPFSFRTMDERQEHYAQQFALDSVYTPQMVVDGAAQFVGSNSAELMRAVAQAAATPKIAITIGDVHRTADGVIEFSVRADAASAKSANLVAALAENATHSEVARGENAGRTLHHVAVVRAMKDFSSGATDGRPLRVTDPDSSATLRTGQLGLIVFLVDRKSGHVVGAAEENLK